MKKLFILRHATALPATDGDFNRNLSAHGINEASLLGDLLSKNGLIPSCVLCSPAERTRQTLAEVVGDAANLKVSFPSNLYNSDASNLLSSTRTVDDEHGSLLVIAHNPGIHEFALQMAGDSIDEIRSFPPSTFCAYECGVDKWGDLSPSKSKLTNVFISGRDYSTN